MTGYRDRWRVLLLSFLPSSRPSFFLSSDPYVPLLLQKVPSTFVSVEEGGEVGSTDVENGNPNRGAVRVQDPEGRKVRSKQRVVISTGSQGPPNQGRGGRLSF